MDAKRQPGIKIDQVFLIESQFRHRPDFLLHAPSTEIAALDINVEIRTFGVPDGKTGGVAVKVATNPGDQAALYQFSVQMGALVSAVQGEENMPPQKYVTEAGAGFLYPFMRECVANLTARGRFGPIYLKPFNIRQALSDENKVVGAPPRRTKRRKASAAPKRKPAK